jgi:hypothetical protein
MVPNDPGDNFQSLTNLDNWESLEEFFETCDERLLEDIKLTLEKRRELREMLLADPVFKSRVRRVNPELQQWAKDQLFGGSVCGVDGTLAVVPSAAGGRARIGVVATSYKSDKIERVVYVSYRQMTEPVSSPADYFKKLKVVNSYSQLLMRAVMAYAERDLALRRSEDWKFVHGELLPYELRTGVGRPANVLPKCLELGARLSKNKQTIGVVEGSDNINLLNAVETLDRFEYVEAKGLDRDLDVFLNGEEDPFNPGQRLRGAHFNDADRRRLEEFIKRYGVKIKVGIFKVGLKPFIFQAHVENFDRAAALVMQDASMQALRGFPLLLDYADQICSQHLVSREFEKQIYFKTARFGIGVIGYHVRARDTRGVCWRGYPTVVFQTAPLAASQSKEGHGLASQARWKASKSQRVLELASSTL